MSHNVSACCCTKFAASLCVNYLMLVSVAMLSSGIQFQMCPNSGQFSCSRKRIYIYIYISSFWAHILIQIHINKANVCLESANGLQLGVANGIIYKCSTAKWISLDWIRDSPGSHAAKLDFGRMNTVFWGNCKAIKWLPYRQGKARYVRSCMLLSL